MSPFFLIVPPGFEELAEAELHIWLREFVLGSAPQIVREKGGLSLELPLEIGFALNGRLKIPSRILLRIADFGCRDFPKLFKKMRGLSWAPWVGENPPVPEFVVSSHGSRLAVKKRIESTCEDGFKAWKKLQAGDAEAVADGKKLTVFVRFFDDVCTVSLDTSGEHLHRRGYKTKATEAPLRENIAAALLYRLLAGTSDVTLIDPMSGSGTFLSESAILPKFLDRKYAFRDFACVRDGGVVVSGEPRGAQQAPHADRFFAFDKSMDAIEAARENFADAGLSDAIQLKQADLFADEYETISGNRIVVCNPPYGERLKVQGSLANLYSKLLHMIDQKFKPMKVGVLLPEKTNPKTLRLPEGWQTKSNLPFSNGGLPVVFYVFERI